MKNLPAPNSTIGTIESLWRYPFKSMRGEEVAEAFAGFSGIYGDRCYAVKSSAAQKGFPYFTATIEGKMLSYQPRFRHPERAALPPNLAEAMSIAPGINPANAEPKDMILDVVTPSGETVSADDPKLLEMLAADVGEKHGLSLHRSDRPFIDCRPVSLISLQSVRQLQSELNFPVDKRRFRANIYVDFADGKEFFEDELVGQKLRIGDAATIMILERDPRCKMISLDPDTGEHNPEVLRQVAKAHDACAGVYAAVLVEGIIKKNDSITILQ